MSFPNFTSAVPEGTRGQLAFQPSSQWITNATFLSASLIVAWSISTALYRRMRPWECSLASATGTDLEFQSTFRPWPASLGRSWPVGLCPQTSGYVAANASPRQALTYAYEIYYDVWLGGQYFRKIAELHRQYGPIVRINPDEVHFNDPDFVDALYPQVGRKTNKPALVATRTGTPNSIVATMDHAVHRQRRNAFNSFFSTASIRRLEPIMRQALMKMLARLADSGKDGEVVEMHTVFKACTSDVISVYAFNDSFNFLDEPDYGKGYFAATDMFFSLNHVFAHFPWVAVLIQSAPAWAIQTFMPVLRELWVKRMWWIEKVRKIRNSPNPELVKSTIFEGILSSNLPDEEKTDARMASESQLVIFAGEGTTAFTLNAALYELLANPTELARLKDELAGAIPEAEIIPSFSQVDGLPFFNAVIQEVIRLHPGVMNRQFRTCPDAPVVYRDPKLGKEYSLPPLTVYSMSPYASHMNADVFDDPYAFRPQRWLDNPKIGRAFMGFSRGSRSCIGMNLARRELCIVLATLLREYDVYRGQAGKTLELYDTLRERDIDPNHEYIIPSPAKGSHGLRVRIRN